MPPDCYKVEVLYLINPHLIWVEVRDSAITSIEEHGIKFEQIGIYGLLPLEPSIDLDDEEITVHRCKEWLPAAATIMRNFLTPDEDIYFSPVYLHRRSSILSDKIHKFGDLHIKKYNGNTKSLSQLLRTSGFATLDAGLFHQYLGGGKISIKLSKMEGKKVLTELEKYFVNKTVTKNKSEKLKVSQELEETFMKVNLEKSNKSTNASLELCKDIDEPSVGRATTRKGKEKTSSTPVEKKLELLQAYKTKVDFKNSDTQSECHDDTFEDNDVSMEASAAPYCKKISSKTDAHKAQILKKVMCKTAVKRGSKQEKLDDRLVTESRETAKPPEEVDVNSKDQKTVSFASTSNDSVLQHDDIPEAKPEETNQSIATNATSTTKEEQDVSDNNIVPKSSNITNQETNRESKSNFESTKKTTVTAQNTASSCPKKDNKTAPNKETNKDSNKDEQDRRPSKGKSPKKVAKVGAYGPTLESSERVNVNKDEANASAPPQQNTAHSSKNGHKDTKPQDSKGIPELLEEYTTYPFKNFNDDSVKNLMEAFKLNRSKHISMIQNAVKKCAKDNAEGMEALKECRSKIKDEIIQLNHYRDKANINLDLSVSQKLAKTKLRRKGKRQIVVKERTRVFGPPDVDANSLTRVPSVFVYGEESNEGKNEAASNRRASKQDPNSSHSSEVGKNDVPNNSNEAKTTPKNIKESETKKHKNYNKGTSAAADWEKRLKLHKKMAKNRRCASLSSDTTNKDSSNVDDSKSPKNFTKPKSVQDSDECLSKVIGKLDIANGKKTNAVTPATSKSNELLHSTFQEVSNQANPFQNFDIFNSIFVDNLLTPIMMVHSKMNKRFVPKSIIRDIHFTDHIRFVLKNLRIDRPMMIQSITWNEILRGNSVFMIGSAYSGKTTGYLPAVCRLVADFNQSESYTDSVGPFCIILCATSQSVFDVENLAKMLVTCNEKVVSCYYGHNEKAIATSLLNGSDLLVCTPPSLVRLLQMPEFGLDLQRLATFVLDDCERLVKVYPAELKYVSHKIKDMLQSRVNKEHMVQYIVASRVWCDFMEPFAKRAPNSVICIGAFQECVLYSKAKMTVSYVQKENKFNHLMKFLEDVDPSKRTVVVCDTDDEVDFLNREIQSSKYFVFASNSRMTVQDLYNLTMLWKEFREPGMAPVLICRDSNLYHMNIVNAFYLVQYSMPSLYSTFCRRFATLNESYPSVFQTDKQSIKILILLEENNVEQFPKIVNFVKRCTNNVPHFLHNMCETVLAQKDVMKAENFVPLCDSLMSLGDCPDLHNCTSRHTMVKRYDEPKEWIPKSGTITFKILHYHSAVCYSARLISHCDENGSTKYPTTYSNLSLKIGLHYSVRTNRILHGILKLGDICAVALRQDLFSRCQVIKIIDRYETGNPRNVLVNLIDEEKIELTSDTNLYYLPEELINQNTFVVNVRLANIQPQDKDVVFSELAKDLVKQETNDFNKGLYMRSNIVLTVANNIYVDTLENCKDLKSLNGTIVVYNVKLELLEKHGEVNPDHINKIKALCENADLITTPKNKKTNEIPQAVKVKPNISWAYLEEGMSIVDFGVIDNPDMLFLRNTKFEECLKILIADIQKYVSENSATVEELVKDDIVLAEYPDDGIYERARIDEVGEEKVKCFFVDQGEWRHLGKDKFKPILDTFITQLPFQAIECRLVGVKPPGDLWTDFASNWLFDKCEEAENGEVKQLYAEYFTKEPARFTGGQKYGVVLIDTYGEDDLILNRAMIDLNLAKEVDDETKFLDDVKRKIDEKVKCHNDEVNDDSSVKPSLQSPNSEKLKTSAPNILFSQPIRSVPLVGTDDDSDETEKWNLNMTGDMAEMLRPMIENSTKSTKPNLPAIENANPITEKVDSSPNAIIDSSDINNLSKSVEECSLKFQRVTIKMDSSKYLDSDDYSSPETCQSGTEASDQAIEKTPLNEAQLRKPKLNWSQTKSSVMIKILLIGVEKYDLKIHQRALTFTATVNDINYGFNIDLYGVIDKKDATHSNKGQYILVKFNKIMQKNWLTLTRDGEIRKWIVYDVDCIDTSSDEEEVQKDNLYNIMRNMHNKVDSDSDEEFVDDVTYRHKTD